MIAPGTLERPVFADPSTARHRVSSLPIDALEPNPFQPRLAIAEPELAALTADMDVYGFRGSIEVRPPREQGGRYQIVAGERRWRAWQRSQKCRGSIPVQIVDYTDAEMRQSAIRENVLREDLTPWEEALAIAPLQQEGMSVRKIAEFVGKSKGWVQGRLTLLRLPEGPLRDAARADPESMTLPKTLMLLPENERDHLFARVKSGELNEEDLRALIRAKREGIRRLEASVRDAGGVRIDVSLEQ